ncbi:protein mahjong [Diabrotica virgifera virgifera]|uniref:DDB1- and CUL4-associated factor 1 n=1 Tax=Diabrotica virgifera virgifera TaxID=50390 RepID=A0ABM5JWD0_DIAVI|nr:protein mahjong [Diabrotica virgifera virgifera]
MASNNTNVSAVMSEVGLIIKKWEDEQHQHMYDPVPTLTRLAEIVEVETENYLKMDPDPFDERHPSRIDPHCLLGQVLKVIFKKDNFSSKLINDYLRDTYYSRNGVSGRDVDQLNIAACRLLLDIMPGLDTTAVYQPESDSLIHRLIKWVMNSVEPLQSYATGLLGAAMEIPEIAARFREQNAKLVPLLLQRLRRLKTSSGFAPPTSRPFAHLSAMRSPPYRGDGRITSAVRSIARENGIHSAENSQTGSPSTARESTDLENDRKRKKSTETQTPLNLQNDILETVDPEIIPPAKKRQRIERSNSTTDQFTEPVYLGSPQKSSTLFAETSNSSWAELESFMIGTLQIFPPNLATRQILILRYLTSIGDQQEFLSHVFEHDALELILCYINVRVTKEARLAFEALKYLSALLCHKKFSIEFIQCKGLEIVLENIPRPSIAATGVSMCFYYLGYCEEAMERVCLLPKHVISHLVKYALWLLECAHDSGRCQSIMFFGLTFQFKVIVDEFDLQDGLRKLHNVIATLPILHPDSDRALLNEEVEISYRQIVRHVCVAYRRYLEVHLYQKVESIRRSQLRPNERLATMLQPSFKACKSSPEEIQQQIDMLFQIMPYRSHWHPVDQLLKLGGITLLLKIIAFAYEWNYSGRAETVRSALDVLAISCVMPKVQLLFCDRVDLPEETLTVGINIILGAAEGEIVADADVQKAALRVIGNCVCAPISRVGGTLGRFSSGTTSSPNKKLKYKSSEDLIQKVWDCVRSNSGIMVLLQLMQVKTPITDADCIRTLACKALAGLARSETVRQIVSKLPLFTSGQLQGLMRDPILQEKRQEHVLFQKYALELLELLSGQGRHTDNNLEASLANIHRASVVAQTKIQFNDRQLLQLIHQHLVQKGCIDTAGLLVKEANLSHAITSVSSQHPTRFRYSSTLTPSRVSRLSISSPKPPPITPSTDSTLALNNSQNASLSIKLIKKSQTLPTFPTTPTHNSRLQKQTSGEPQIWGGMHEDVSPSSEQPRVTLDSIITEYLTNQHALCKNPMATCPQFNLFVPHKCPDPKPRITTANNYVLRSARKQIGYNSKTMDRRFVHSRFCPVQTIKSSMEEGFFTCAKFMPGQKTLAVGDYNGEVHIFNLHKGSVVNLFAAHDNYIVNIEPNRTGDFMLTSSTWGSPVSALWDLSSFSLKMTFNEEEHVEFSKVTQEKVIGTKGEIATIFDINTGQSLMKLTPRISNQYTKNKATFSYNDELVLSDGVLFDVSSGKPIHKLDKLNPIQSGVFHPNGLEIVSNTEVWDIRTFHLLKTVPVLNQCSIIFSPVNTAIYAIALEQEMDDGDSAFDTSFKTVDAIDYASITTFDVKKSIYDLACDNFDTQIAVVENQGLYNSVQESAVRVYDVGRRRDDEDEQEEDEEDSMEGSDDSENDDGDGDNNDNDDNNDDDDGDDNDNDSDAESWTSLSSGGSGDNLDFGALLASL